jgi:CRISPR-associated protein Csx17
MSMTATTPIPLPGCAPIPLAHYLKALGILRLIAEDKEHGDPQAKGFWKNDCFYLSTKLNKQDLVEFFLNHYQPTPILSPWNGGGGFYFQEEKLNKKDPITGKKIKTGIRNQSTAATDVVDSILKTSSLRFATYRLAIQIAKGILQKHKFEEAPEGSQKDDLISELRNNWPEIVVSWIDCVTILINSDSSNGSSLEAAYPPLLGTGANDGNTDFTSNFMQRLCTVIPTDETVQLDFEKIQMTLRAALFGEVSPGVVESAAIGQFFPGSSGGMNNASSFSGYSSVNPWDFILMIEGALLFAAAAVKRLRQAADGSMVYPFCVRQTGVGYGSAATDDETSSRDEIWFPIWETPVGLSELQAVFGEARSQVGSRQSRNAVDFTRAVVTLGVDRGFTTFHRYGFCQRNGKNFFATPLERVVVKRNARADLLVDVDHWLDRLRSKTGPKSNPPASVTRALNQLEAKILDLCKNDDPAHTQGVLIALGRAQKALAHSLRWTKSDTVNLRPLAGLSTLWAEKANTVSPEFRLAVTLASTWGRYGDKVMLLRQHLEPVESKGRGRLDWAENPSNDVVWHEDDFVGVLNAIFARRVVHAMQTNTNGFPDASPCPARLSDLADFIEGRTEDDLIADLVWGLSLIDWSKMEPAIRDIPKEELVSPSSLYALLRLCFRDKHKDLETVPVVGAIHRWAAQDNGSQAADLAIRRLRASGYPPAIKAISVTGETVRRTAAALLFPIAFSDFRHLEKNILRQQETTQP